VAGFGAFRANGHRGCSVGAGGTRFKLPEAYWAPITTLVITQSSLGATLTVSWQRFVGTALGALEALVSAIAASCGRRGASHQGAKSEFFLHSLENGGMAKKKPLTLRARIQTVAKT
jgi:hypothetical protein